MVRQVKFHPLHCFSSAGRSKSELLHCDSCTIFNWSKIPVEFSQNAVVNHQTKFGLRSLSMPNTINQRCKSVCKAPSLQTTEKKSICIYFLACCSRHGTGINQARLPIECLCQHRRQSKKKSCLWLAISVANQKQMHHHAWENLNATTNGKALLLQPAALKILFSMEIRTYEHHRDHRRPSRVSHTYSHTSANHLRLSEWQ